MSEPTSGRVSSPLDDAELWVAYRHDDGTWQVAQEGSRRTEWVCEGGRQAKTIANHRNGKHGLRKNKTCIECATTPARVSLASTRTEAP